MLKRISRSIVVVFFLLPSAGAAQDECPCKYQIVLPAPTLEPRRGDDVGIGEAILVLPVRGTNTDQNPDCAATFHMMPQPSREHIEETNPWRGILRTGFTSGSLEVTALGAAHTKYEGRLFASRRFNIIAPEYFEHLAPQLTLPYTNLVAAPPARYFGGRFRFNSILRPAWVNFDHLILQEQVQPLYFAWPDGTANHQLPENIEFSTRMNMSHDNAGLREPNAIRLLRGALAPFTFDLILNNCYQRDDGKWVTFETDEIHRHIVVPTGAMQVQILHQNGEVISSDFVGPWSNRGE